MDKKLVDSYMATAVAWTINAAEEISRAGGSPKAVLNMMPHEVINTMIRNNLGIKYHGPVG